MGNPRHRFYVHKRSNAPKGSAFGQIARPIAPHRAGPKRGKLCAGRRWRVFAAQRR